MKERSPLHVEADHLETPEGLTPDEEQVVEEKQRLRSAVIYEIIRIEGEAQLARKFNALWWSGLAAGLSIGFSYLAQAWLAASLPHTEWSHMVAKLGYTVGFLMVIMGHLQLFTENTLTAVLPVMARRKWRWLGVLLRLWLIVLTANILGCLLFALYIAKSGVVSPQVYESLTEISVHVMANEPSQMFIRGIAAGWIIALLVWILPTAEASKFAVIFLFTYLIALGEFTHVIAGSAEAFFLWIEGGLTASDMVFRFFFPTLLGNVAGGTALFASLIYVQVRDEIDENSQ